MHAFSDMELRVEIDARETCFASVSKSVFDQLHSPQFVRLVEKDVCVSLLPNGKVAFGVLELGKDFAKCLGLAPGQTVNCHALTPARSSAPIVVSPASQDDWEVVESLSEMLEGTILTQIKVLSPGMKFPVWTARGQKPILLQVDQRSTMHSLLGPDSELAIEARVRKADLTAGVRGFLPVRVVEAGDSFWAKREDLLGVGFVVNFADFNNAFSKSGGCIVTVRDRPEIVSLVACDSTVCDVGVLLVAPVMRDKYALVSGMRIVLEEYVAELGCSLVVPNSLSLYSQSEEGVFEKFCTFLHSARCLMVPQGGWVEVGGRYVQVRFPSDASAQIALVTATDISNISVTTHTLSDQESSSPPSPFLKYIPSEMHGYVWDRNYFFTKTHFLQTDFHPLPSFRSPIRSLSAYIEASFQVANPSLPFAGSALLLAASGAATAARQAVLSLDPPMAYLQLDCGALSDPSRFRLADIQATFTGMIRYAFETPPMVIFFKHVDKLLVSSSAEDSLEDAQRKSQRGKILFHHLQDLLRKLRPNRSLFLLGSAVEDSPTLASLFVHCERLPRELTAEDREFLLPGLSGVEGCSLMELVEIKRTGGVDNRAKRKQLLMGKKSIIGKTQIAAALGGLDAQLGSLKDAIELPLKFPLLFRSPNGRPLMSTGALVVGPTGCGKSALIDRLVRETNLPVELVRGPDLLDKYIGASEQGVRRVFEKAASVAPSILVFDTVDALCPRRGSESTGVTDRVVNQMLCYLDGVDRVDGVFVIAVTSRPDMVDPALTRPGRLDLVVLCDIPTTDEKMDIVNALWPEFVESDEEAQKDSIITQELVAMLSPACTGADIRAAFVNAKILASRQKVQVSIDLLRKCFREIKPSISDGDAQHYARQLSRYKNAGKSMDPQVDSNIGTRVMLH